MWLPLLAEKGFPCIAAPSDVAWVWHCHMLAPLAYARDCQKLYGRIIDHKLMGSKDRTYSLKRAQNLWEEKYRNIPFNVSESDFVSVPSDFHSQMSYDLEAAISRQKVFFYQVSLPHYGDSKFLLSSVTRYQKFLYLKKCSPDSFVVPCYDIDLIWHSHQLHPIFYKEDTLRILGEHFNHDDSVNDRSNGSKLCRSMTDTQTLWEELFHEKFTNIGSMYRGLPPNGRLNDIPKEALFTNCHKMAVIELQNIMVARESPLASARKKVHSLKFCTEFTSGITVDLIKLKKPDSNYQWTTETHGVNSFEIDSRFCDFLMVKVKQSGSCTLFKHSISGTLSMMPLLESCVTLNEKVYVNSDVKLSDGSILELKLGITVTSLTTCKLDLLMGNFESCVMPEYVEQLWGPVHLPRLPQGTDNVCSVASHK